MKSKEFIKNSLNNLFDKFDIKLRYEYRESTTSHLIEVIPLHVFEEDKDYMQAEFNFENEFEELFPNENIVFISEDSLTEIKESEFELGYDTNSLEDYTSFFEFDFEEIIDTQDNYALAA